MNKPFVACVAGSPIDHSKSPALHRAALAALAQSGTYERVELTEDQLAGHLDSHGELVGVSCTMPLKVRLAHLATERGWHIDDTVDLTGVANTFVRLDTPHVFNTDVAGIVGALTDYTGSRQFTTAAVLGSGATARSAVAALSRLGCTRVSLHARNPITRSELADLGTRVGLEVSGGDLGAVNWDTDVIISTLPTAVPLDVPTRVGQARRPVVLDVAYAHGSLGERAGLAGAEVVPGLVMLVEQAVAQFVLFMQATGRNLSTAETARVRRAMYVAVDCEKGPAC